MKNATTIRRRAWGCIAARCLALAFLVLCAAAAHAQLIYPTGSVYAAGTVTPSADIKSGNIAGGYFGNGNGKTFDLAVTNSSGYGPVLSIFPGNGDGTFAAPTNYSLTDPGWNTSGIQDGLSTIFAGPLMSANSVDLVAIDDESNLFVIPGNDDGTFGAPVNLNQVAYGFNVFPDPGGSGLLDLVTYLSTYNAGTEATTYTVTVLTNQGSGTFTAQTLLSNSSYGVGEVDYLNIAGTPTLMIVGTNSTVETSSYSSPSGPWGTPAIFNLNLNSCSASISQVTPFTLNSNDSFAALCNGDVYLWIGNTQGFNNPKGYTFNAISPVQLGVADLNDDGTLGLVVLGGGPFSTNQYVVPASINSSNGQLTTGTPTGPGVYGSQFILGDINGDGYPDIVLMQWNQGLTVLLNQDNGTFPDPPTTLANTQPTVPPSSSGVSPFPVAMAAADLNGGQLNDVVVVDGNNPESIVTTNSVAVFLNQGNGILGQETDYAVGNDPVAIAISPVNGNQSLFVANSADQNVSFLQGNGNGTFDAQQTFTGGDLSSANPLGIAVGTIDSSGGPGVVVSDNSGEITVFTYSSSGPTWTAGQTITAVSNAEIGSGINAIALQDVTGDGNADIVATVAGTCSYNIQTGLNTLTNGKVLVYPGLGNGNFKQTPISFTSSQSGWNPGNLAIGSLTGQTTPDVVVLTTKIANCPTVSDSSAPLPIAVFNDLTGTLQEIDLASPFASITFQDVAGGLAASPYAAVAPANGGTTNDLVLAVGGLVAVIPGTGTTAFGTPSVQVASANTEGFATGSFFTTGGHDLAMASTAGVAILESLLGKGVASVGKPYAEFNPVPLPFPEVAPGNSLSQSLTLTNAQTGVLNVSSYSIQNADGTAAPEFTLESVVCGATTNPPSISLTANASCTFNVAFSPTYGGSLNAELVFNDNASQSNVTSTPQAGPAPYQQIVSITGTGQGGTPIQISPATLPALGINTAFSQSFSAIGGSGGYVFSETGALPSGVTFKNAVLSGTPTSAGNFPITVTATDSPNVTGSVNLTLAVGCPLLAITPASETLAPASIGIGYTTPFLVKNTNGAFSWSITGALPTGLTFTGGSSTATSVAGTPKGPTGDSSFALSVTDSAGCFVENNYLIPVDKPLTFITNPLPTGTVGVPYLSGFTATGGTAPYTYFTATAPPGLTLDSQSGVLSGTPTRSGNFTMTVLATDSKGIEGIDQAPLTVNPAPPVSDAEQIGITDTVAVTLFDTAANENIGLTDTVAVTLLDAAANENIGLTDAVTVTLLDSAANENIGLTDTVSVQVFSTIGTLTVTANNASRMYGAPNPTFTGSVTGAKNGDSFTESFSTMATPTSAPGQYSIVPSANGADLGDYNVVTDDGTLTVTKAGVNVSLATSTSNSNLNAPVTFTATVKSQTSGTPTGSVEFYVGSTVLGSAGLNAQGVATYTTSAFTAGTYTVIASYEGDPDFAIGSASISQQVTAPAYSLTATPSTVNLKAGQAATVIITLIPVGGFTGTITLSCGHVPAYVSCIFDPTTLSADGSNTVQTAKLTIETSGSASGTIAANRSGGIGVATASICLMPALILGGFLGWRRRRLYCGWMTLLWVFGTALAISIPIGCGFSAAETKAGTYTLTITAAASDTGAAYTGPASESIDLVVTISD